MYIMYIYLLGKAPIKAKLDGQDSEQKTVQIPNFYMRIL